MQPLKILLADDSKANRTIATRLLEKWGHRVILALNGREAVTSCRREAFDLVLMDVQMPVMDGLQATEAIRQSEITSGRHVPILALTARAMEGDRERCLQAGMDGCVTKPIRRQELFGAMNAVLSEAATSSNAEASGADTAPGEDGADASCIDWDEALRTTDNDVNLLCAVIQETLQETPELLEGLRHAIEQNDVEEARRTAHTIKGAGRSFGCEIVVRWGAAGEIAAAEGDHGRLNESLEPICRAVDQMMTELRMYLHEHQ